MLWGWIPLKDSGGLLVSGLVIPKLEPLQGEIQECCREQLTSHIMTVSAKCNTQNHESRDHTQK